MGVTFTGIGGDAAGARLPKNQLRKKGEKKGQATFLTL